LRLPNGQIKIVDPRRHPKPEVIEEWSRRRVHYRQITRTSRIASHIILAIAVALVVLGTGEARWWGAGLFFAAFVVSRSVLQVMTFQILRCPSCGLLPQARGAAYDARSCSRCLNPLPADELPAPLATPQPIETVSRAREPATEDHPTT